MPTANRVLMLVCLCGGLLAVDLAASANQGAPVPLAERARGAERVVVGRVASVAPLWRVNEFGDRLIVSVVRVLVSETLKGQPADARCSKWKAADWELTLHVSDQTSFPG